MSTEETKPMTWQEMKDFANSLSEDQLKEKVILWREEEAITSISAYPLEENYWIHKDREVSDGCFQESEMNWQLKHCADDFPNGKEDFEMVYEKGRPMLAENF